MKNLLLLLSLIIVVFEAQSATLVEPYAGIHVNSNATNNDCSSSCVKSISGNAVGGRLAFQNLGLMVGLNGKRSWHEIEDLSKAYGDGVTDTLGLFVGYDFPILLRVWGEYIFSGSLTWEDDSNRTWNADSGTTLGVGYKAFPFVSFNLEVTNLNFNEQDNNGTATDIDYNFKTYMLSVSIPLTL